MKNQQNTASIAPDPFASATKVAITLHGREYFVACGAGEAKRLEEIVQFVDGKLGELAKRNDGVSETRLFMLACLMLADELIETKKETATQRRKDENLYVAAVDHLRERVESIAAKIGK